MTTITLTQFNRNPSRVAKIAREQDVIITDHGVPALEVRRVDSRGGRLDRLRRAGQLRPARDRSSDPFPDFGVDPDVADRLFEEFEEERARREY